MPGVEYALEVANEVINDKGQAYVEISFEVE